MTVVSRLLTESPVRSAVVRASAFAYGWWYWHSVRRGLGTEFSTSHIDSTKRLFSELKRRFCFYACNAQLCVTVTAATMAELRERRDHVTDADLVELRARHRRATRARRAPLRARGCPVIVTCRPTWEGGQFAGSEEER